MKMNGSRRPISVVDVKNAKVLRVVSVKNKFNNPKNIK